MDFISVKTTAQKWGIDTSRVGRLAREGRIPGAKLVGHNWLIPADAKKPLDERRSEVKNKPIDGEERNFRFPSFSHAPADSFTPPLSKEETVLRDVEILVWECRFGDAKRVLGNLPTNAVNRYCRCGALYYACLISANEADALSFSYYTSRFVNEFKTDFPYKKEMEILFYLIKANYGQMGFFIKDFSLSPEYSYHPSAFPMLQACSAFAVYLSNMMEISDNHFTVMELNCQTLETTGRFLEAQSIHISLLILYSLHQEKKNAEYHAKQALRLAFEHRLYYFPTSFIPYFGECFEKAYSDFPADFIGLIREASNALHAHYLLFSERMHFSGFYNRLPERYFPLVNYALTDLPNKTIANLMGLSESTVNNRYSEIYDILGIKGKTELKQLFREKFTTGGDEPQKINTFQ